MELNDIQKLMQTFNDTGLSRLQYNNGTESLVLEKGTLLNQAPAPQAVQVTPAPVHHEGHPTLLRIEEVRTPAAPVVEKPAATAEDVIKAPMVGVFYLAPSPDASPYVQLGQAVVKGQTLCILEAMKVLNEIQAEWDGVVEAVLAQPEDIVEYGQPLFRVRRA